MEASSMCYKMSQRQALVVNIPRCKNGSFISDNKEIELYQCK